MANDTIRASLLTSSPHAASTADSSEAGVVNVRARSRITRYRSVLEQELCHFTLFSLPRIEDANDPIFDTVYSLAFLAIAVSASLAIGFYQWSHRSGVLVSYRTDNPIPLSNAFSCSCALPDYLTGIDDIKPVHHDRNFSKIKLCYQKASLEKVTVVSFSNVTVPELLDVYSGGDEAAGPQHGLSLRPVFKVINDTYLATDRLSELDLWEEDPYQMLSPLYEDFLRYFRDQEVVDMGVEQILRSNLFEFPSYYMFMMVQFDCKNYSTCSPSAILRSIDSNFIDQQDSNLVNSTEYVANDWLTCGGYDGRDEWDPILSTYHGRCMVYPTYPTMSARVKNLTGFVHYCPDISHLGGYFNAPNAVSFISRMEQINQSSVIDRVPMVMGYLEVRPGSPQWFRLTDHYPGVRFECSSTLRHGTNSRGWTEVCNASSVCLTYKTAAAVGFSSVRMKCMDFDRYNYTNCVMLANTTGNSDRVGDICNPNASCKYVPSRKVRRQVMSTTELNNMNVQVLESENNATVKEGVCRNTYINVVRYNSTSLKQTVLLETNCSQAAGLCKLTGRYNQVDDEPGMRTPRLLTDEDVVAAARSSEPFVCYGTEKVKFTSWAINTAGVISGWISSIYYICKTIYGHVMRFEP